MDELNENEIKALFALISQFGFADAVTLSASEFEARNMMNALYKLEKRLLEE